MHRRNAHMREIVENLQKSQKRHHSHRALAHHQERPEPVIVQPVQQVNESRLTRSAADHPIGCGGSNTFLGAHSHAPA
jgi:hypothetical protein